MAKNAKQQAAIAIAKKAKMKKGGSLGMKSVNAGYDKNPGITKADPIIAAKQNAGKMKKGGAVKSKKK